MFLPSYFFIVVSLSVAMVSVFSSCKKAGVSPDLGLVKTQVRTSCGEGAVSYAVSVYAHKEWISAAMNAMLVPGKYAPPTHFTSDLLRPSNPEPQINSN